MGTLGATGQGGGGRAGQLLEGVWRKKGQALPHQPVREGARVPQCTGAQAPHVRLSCMVPAYTAYSLEVECLFQGGAPHCPLGWSHIKKQTNQPTNQPNKQKPWERPAPAAKLWPPLPDIYTSVTEKQNVSKGQLHPLISVSVEKCQDPDTHNGSSSVMGLVTPTPGAHTSVTTPSPGGGLRVCQIFYSRSDGLSPWRRGDKKTMASAWGELLGSLCIVVPGGHQPPGCCWEVPVEGPRGRNQGASHCRVLRG